MTAPTSDIRPRAAAERGFSAGSLLSLLSIPLAIVALRLKLGEGAT